MAILIGLTVTIGSLVSQILPHSIVAFFSGILFIIIGIFYFFRWDNRVVTGKRDSGFMQTLILIFVAELGDKTHLATLFLAASLGFPLGVFIGAMLAMFFNHLLAVYLGSRFIARIKPQFLRIGTAVIFIGIGLLIILREWLSIESIF